MIEIRNSAMCFDQQVVAVVKDIASRLAREVLGSILLPVKSGAVSPTLLISLHNHYKVLCRKALIHHNI